MNEDKKSKDKYTILISIAVLLVIVIGITYAFYQASVSNNNILGEAECYNVNYTKGQDITGELEVGESYTSGKSTDVIMYSDPNCGTMSGTLYITTNDSSTMDFSDKALKYTVVVNDVVVSEGSIDGTANQVIYSNFILNTTSTTYKVYVWLDSSLEDTSDTTDETYSGFIHASAVMTSSITTPPNAPKLADGLIPVHYNETTSKWVKADIEENNVTLTCDMLGDANLDGVVDQLDITRMGRFISGNTTPTDKQLLCSDLDGDGAVTSNDQTLLASSSVGSSVPAGIIGSPVTSNTTQTNKWYDYDKKQWANAVLVTDTNRSTYQSASAGTEIAESDILAFYVWIPRYKYKVWNINKVVGTDSYNAQSTGIDIVFESGTSSTGTISCNYDFTITDGSLSETCTGSNGDYYTHPAFTFGNEELTGFWIGKFEVSNSTSEIRVLPNVASLRSKTVSSFYSAIMNMQASSNVYGLLTDASKVDSHMLKNMEWGAVAYLTNSKYGRCTDGTCTEVEKNSNSNYTTGCGPQSQGSTSSGSTCNAYNTALGMLSSTTGNIYGVYDMSGGADEYVMGNSSSTSGNYTYNNKNGSNYNYTSETAKYINEYAYETSSIVQADCNRARLGDATGEIVLSIGDTSGWYGDLSDFPYSSRPWFMRGGCYFQDSVAGVFYFNYESGESDSDYSARSALVVY